MKIFTELHHQQLYTSFQILFEKRLGYELYRPIGTEWATEGFWNNAKIYNNHPDTIKQFLEIRNTVPTKMGPYNEVIAENENYYTIANSYMNERAVTLDQFRKLKPDIVIASYYDNAEPFSRLAKEVGAKLIFQMGNVWPVPWEIVDNVLASTGKFPVPQGKNVLFYHQEFDLDIYHKGEADFSSKNMMSFVNCLPEHDMHRKDWEAFQELEKLMPEYNFKSYGISCRDGIVTSQPKIAELMRSCKFGIHLKGNGDGYGHVIHNWFAVGRPVIFKSSQYKGKLAENLLKHLVTGLDLDRMSLIDIAAFIRNQTKEDYEKMSENAYKAFKENVDFDKEEESVKLFLERLL